MEVVLEREPGGGSIQVSAYGCIAPMHTSKARNSLPDLLRFFLIKCLEGICLPFYLSGPTGTLNHLRAYEITGLSIPPGVCIQSCSLDRLEVEVYLSILEISDLHRSEALDLVLSIYLKIDIP